MIDLNSPLQNGFVINGVANFYTSTKPTTRVDGSALVIGDLWVNPSTQTQWQWNGTYWLSALMISPFAQLINSSGSINVNFGIDSPEYNIFAEKILWTGKTGSANNGSNYRGINLNKFDNNGTNTVLISNITNTATYTASTYFAIAFAWNYLITTSGTVANSATPTIQSYYLQSLVIAGTPNPVYEGLQVQYRLAVK
jgi:hypothetical protein